MTKKVVQELREIDYLHKLSESEREYLIQFLMEYEQGDFNYEKTIHPPSYKKECQNRNNASKRQVHSVGEQILEESAHKAREAQGVKGLRHRYYTPEDYSTDKIYTEEGEDDGD